MAERSDITTDWGVFGRSSPRIIEVAAPSTILKIQDLVDTIRSNSQQPGEPVLDNLDDDPILSQEFDPAGKVPTEPGIQSGIICTLFNAKLKFADRAGPATVLCRATEGTLVSYLRDEGTHTGADSNTVLIDSAADFINFGIEEKDVDQFQVLNVTDGSSALVSTVDSGTQITTTGLSGGSDNTFQSGDVIVVQGFALSPIEPSAFTSVSYATSVAPSITNLVTMESQIADIHGQVEREIWIDTSLGTNGNGYQSAPYNNVTDAIDDAEANGIRALVVLDDITLDRQLKNFTIRGIGEPSIDPNNQILTGCQLDHLSFSGTFNPTLDSNHFNHCYFQNGTTGLQGDMHFCGFDGVVSLAPGNTSTIIDGYSLVPGLSRPTIDTGGSGSMVSIRDWRGGLIIAGTDGALDEVTVSLAMGRLQLAASNTAGTISVRGSCNYEDLSNGSIVNIDGLLEPEQLRELWTLLGLKPGDRVTITPSGVTTQQGTFTITFTGDGINTTTQERTA